MAEDWIEQLLRDFQDVITRGAYAGIYRLEPEQLDEVMRCQAHACFGAFVQLYDIPEHLDLDAFLERMATAGSSPMRIRREGDTIYWEELHEGHCMCPFVKRGVIDLEPGLCRCAVHWARMLIERHAHRPAHVELVDSVARGAQNCVFRITLGEGSNDSPASRGSATPAKGS